MKKILLLCNNTKNIAATVNDHVTSFKKYSKFTIDTLDCLKEKATMALLDQYDALIIHYSLWIELDHNLSPMNRFLIANYSGPKIIFMQDENRNVNKLISCLQALNINIIFTCIPEEEVHKVYTQQNLPDVKIFSTKTGFVTQELLDLELPSYDERPLDVVYRARKLSAWYGRLCYEKYTIADRFLIDAKNHNLKVDISALESDRIYGNAWIEFLLTSKSCLGVESGASLFDFTGNIREQVEKHELLHPNTPFEQLEQLYFKGLDYNVHYNQISPRHFESAALKTLMILYEGEYSGILKPWLHYVPLKKDHSNIVAVVEALKDEKIWQRITENAYQEIALNPQFTYQSFIEKVDAHLTNYFNEYKITTKTSKSTIVSNTIASAPSSTAKTGLVHHVAKAKNLLRRAIAKIYWWMDRFCNIEQQNFLLKLISNGMRFIKNSLKTIDMKLRNHNKSSNKLIILINYLYYKKLYKKPLLFNTQHSNNSYHLFCMLPEQHQELTEQKSFQAVKFNPFKKTIVCDNCKWFIGL